MWDDSFLAGPPGLHLPVVWAGQEVVGGVTDDAAVVEDGHILDALAVITTAERDHWREGEAGLALGAVGDIAAA